jgi:hypothetical protein
MKVTGFFVRALVAVLLLLLALSASGLDRLALVAAVTAILLAVGGFVALLAESLCGLMRPPK